VFPYTTPRGSEGVIYLEGMPAQIAPEVLMICQSFLNLVPLAFLTLPAAAPEEGPEAVEVQPEEVTEGRG